MKRTSARKTIRMAWSLGTLPVFYFSTAVGIAVKIASPVATSIKTTPASLGLKYEDVTFPARVDGLKLRGWYIPGGKRGAVIMVHGGKGNRTNDSLLELAGDLSKRGFDVLTFDRRDCGESERSKRRDRMHFERDVGGAYDLVTTRNGRDENIFLYGTSAGALSVMAFASEGPDVKGMVLDSCIVDTMKAIKTAIGPKAEPLSLMIPGIRLAARMLYGAGKIGARDFIGSVRAPILFIQGELDDAAPPEDVRELLRSSSNPASQLWVILGGRHSQGYLMEGRRYVDRMVSFFDAVAG